METVNCIKNPPDTTSIGSKPVAVSKSDGFLLQFDIARKLFPARRPGAKRGAETEFKNFCRHKDWQKVLPLLKLAIERQIKWRQEVNSKNYANPKFREFVPEWPNLQTWINQRRWEEEFELPSETKTRKNFKPDTTLPDIDLKDVPNYDIDEARQQQERRLKMRRDLFK